MMMDMGTTAASEFGMEQPDSKLVDLRQIGASLRRRQWWALGVLLLVLAGTALLYLKMPRRYTATASVALDRRVDDLVAQNAATSELPTDSSSVDTEVQVLTSPTLMSEVADALGLANRRGIGQPVSGAAVPIDQARRNATKRLMSGVQVKRTGTSYAINVGFESPDPVLSAAVANKVVDQYVADQRNGKISQRSRDTELLKERLDKLRGDVIRAEAAVARYRAATNLVDIEKDSTPIQQEISVLNTQLATAEAERAAAQARLAAGVNGSEASPAIGALRTQQAQLSAQRAELAGRYGPLHPDLARIDRQLSDVNRSIAGETARIRQSQIADARVAEGRASAIRQSLSRAQGGLVAGNNASVQLNELERNAESSRQLYQSLLDRYRQSVAGQGTERSNAYVIAHALTPSAPTSPNLVVFGVAGLLAALLGAGAVVLVLEMLESGVQSRQDVERALAVPVVGTVPDLATVPGSGYRRRDPLGPADYLIANEASLFGEAFRSIRTSLHLGYGNQAVRTVAVCSALPDEGKTTAAICLARSSALAGIRTVLVDCDLRRRASSRTLAGTFSAGLLDVLRGEAKLDQALVVDEASGAFILPQGDAKSGYDLITQPAMERLISSLSASFDLVVLDTAPVLPLAEARAVAAMVDGVVLAVRWRKTPVHAAKLAVDMLHRAGARVLGATLTRVDLKAQARSGYGDELMYYKNFKNYYSEG